MLSNLRKLQHIAPKSGGKNACFLKVLEVNIMILSGHPTGNPNSHQAALAFYERRQLFAYCVPWFPRPWQLNSLAALPGCKAEASRLRRRYFEPLRAAKMKQGRAGEWIRLARRFVGLGSPALSYEANDWLMRAMAREIRHREITAVHSYEDCSLWQFQEAKRLGKQCIYDMPTCFHAWWEQAELDVLSRYSNWMPPGKRDSSAWARPQQKRAEMELADLVLCPSSFVQRTFSEFYPDQKTSLALYGVDAEFWRPAGIREQGEAPRLGEMALRQRRELEKGGGGQSGGQKPVTALLATSGLPRATSPLRFIYAGQSSIRKGTPFLLEAWEKAALHDAELVFVGSWQLADAKLKQLPRGMRFFGPVGPEQLRELYRKSDTFVFPSFGDGFGLVILEAMACGLPVISSDCCAGPDVLDEACGRVVAAGDMEHLVETLRWFAANRNLLPQMKKAARTKAESFTWGNYRKAVSKAVAGV